MKKTVLVTGGTGFLGSRLVRRLLADGWEVLAAKRSSSSMARLTPLPAGLRLFDLDRTSPKDVFRGAGVHAVLHCATDYGRGPAPDSALVEANLLLPLRLLESAAENGTWIFINADTALDRKVSRYALSKNQFREWLEGFSSRMTAINVSLDLLFGPGDDPSKSIQSMVDRVVRGVDEIDLTPGEQRRDFIYIDDVLDLFSLLLRRGEAMGKGYFPYGGGSGRGLSIREFMETLKRLAGNTRTRLNFGALPYRRHEDMEPRLDGIGASRALGWSPRVPLEEGLLRMIAEARRGEAAAP